MLDALPPVRDASSRVSGVDDVALVARGAVKRLVSIFSGAAGLGWWHKPHGTSVSTKREELFNCCTSEYFGVNSKGWTMF